MSKSAENTRQLAVDNMVRVHYPSTYTGKRRWREGQLGRIISIYDETYINVRLSADAEVGWGEITLFHPHLLIKTG